MRESSCARALLFFMCAAGSASGTSMKRSLVSRPNMGPSVTKEKRYSRPTSRAESPKLRTAICSQVSSSGWSRVELPDLRDGALEVEVERTRGPVDDAEARPPRALQQVGEVDVGRVGAADVGAVVVVRPHDGDELSPAADGRAGRAARRACRTPWSSRAAGRWPRAAGSGRRPCERRSATCPWRARPGACPVSFECAPEGAHQLADGEDEASAGSPWNSCFHAAGNSSSLMPVQGVASVAEPHRQPVICGYGRAVADLRLVVGVALGRVGIGQLVLAAR